MSNNITEQYLKFKPPSSEQVEKIVQSITQQEKFHITQLLHTGRILSDKISTIIYEGEYYIPASVDISTDLPADHAQSQTVPAVLKIIFTNQENPEPELIEKFNKQNLHAKVRLPRVYKYVGYQVKDGVRFMYYIMEKVQGEQVEELPVFDPKLAKRFVDFYKAYKESNLQPFFEPAPEERYSLAFILNRFHRWLQSANQIEPLIASDYRVINQYTGTVAGFLEHLPMQFMHRHLRMEDFAVVNTPNGPEYVIFSVAFFSFIPKFYDLTFHIWHAIEMAHKVENYETREIQEYSDFVNKWLQVYKDAGFIQTPFEEKAFWALMAERAAGSLIIDLRVRKHKLREDAKKSYPHVKQVWNHVFDYALDRFKQIP